MFLNLLVSLCRGMTPLEGMVYKPHLKRFKKVFVCRYPVASKDLKAGDTILEEKPLSWAPMLDTRPVCLTCLDNVSTLDIINFSRHFKHPFSGDWILPLHNMWMANVR
jgi:hypothetical protein